MENSITTINLCQLLTVNGVSYFVYPLGLFPYPINKDNYTPCVRSCQPRHAERWCDVRLTFPESFLRIILLYSPNSEN